MKKSTKRTRLSEEEINFSVALGRALAACRRAAGISQTELGTRMGITFQQVQKYESGLNNITLWRAKQAAQAVGINLADLMQYAGHGEAFRESESPSRSLHAMGMLNSLPATQLVAFTNLLRTITKGDEHADPVS